MTTPAIELLHQAIVQRVKDQPLPCYPCPHKSACCAYGTSLTPGEAKRLLRSHGEGAVYLTHWNEWRTRRRGGKCVFLVDNACSLHDSPDYPAVCRGFPVTDGSGKKPYGPYADICPEIATVVAKVERLREKGRRARPTA
ncbi:MAG: YkgJ family cysteine cluster protein [Planctomycetes bacterium]|nr:YkgJ family cysteine cluster protein [Planctomycetota bacterium]